MKSAISQKISGIERSSELMGPVLARGPQFNSVKYKELSESSTMPKEIVPT